MFKKNKIYYLNTWHMLFPFKHWKYYHYYFFFEWNEFIIRITRRGPQYWSADDLWWVYTRFPFVQKGNRSSITTSYQSPTLQKRKWNAPLLYKTIQIWNNFYKSLKNEQKYQCSYQLSFGFLVQRFQTKFYFALFPDMLC
jgi:hypothetical protein